MISLQIPLRCTWQSASDDCPYITCRPMMSNARSSSLSYICAPPVTAASFVFFLCTMLHAHSSLDNLMCAPFTTAYSLFSMILTHSSFIGAPRTAYERFFSEQDKSFLFMIFAPCLMRTPPFLATFVYPSTLHRLVFAPCLTHTPPFTTICRFCHIY